jgi:hypothetical protein
MLVQKVSPKERAKMQEEELQAGCSAHTLCTLIFIKLQIANADWPKFRPYKSKVK